MKKTYITPVTETAKFEGIQMICQLAAVSTPADGSDVLSKERTGSALDNSDFVKGNDWNN